MDRQFEYGVDSLDLVCASPSPDRVMVIARGEGYIVRVDNPDEWEWAAVVPMIDIQRVPGRDILVCADAQDLIAYSKNGLIWTIDHLALDDLQITLVSREAIKGFARDPASGKVPFSVDPVTGRLEGGSELATVSNSGDPQWVQS